MNDSGPTRFVLLRFLERVQLRDLARTRQRIADEERRDAERRRCIEEKPAPSAWLLEQGLNRHSPPVHVHTGDCWDAGKRSAGIELGQARQAIADGVKGCPHCRLDSALGVLG
ncbi:DUF6233 domain-containing protein [Streptomyces sp. NPDC047829]|uniref:DUF6233 domain-containing protein n=1 Tax=Streptomyces sp. NPDC047829 TaxID=3154609 RepID=UPI0033EA0AB5